MRLLHRFPATAAHTPDRSRTRPWFRFIGTERTALVIGAAIVALVLPSLLWCLSDQSVWAWDQSSYGDWALRTWAAHRSGAWAWLQAMNAAVASAPPLIVWLGQFFLPLRHLTGQFEAALLLLNLCLDVAILWLVNAVTRDLGCRTMERTAAILACGGAGIVIALCRQFLVETIMGAAAAFTIYVAVRAGRVSTVRLVALLVLAISLSLLAKASSGIFLVPLACYVAIALFLARGRARPPPNNLDNALLVVACLAAVATVVWYVTNWPYMAERFINATVAGEVALFYGSPVDLGRKIPYWIASLGLSLSSFAWIGTAIAGTVFIALALAIARSFRGGAHGWLERAWDDNTLFAATLAGSVIATIMVFSLQINEGTRFLITTTPMIAVLVGWSLNILGRQPVTAAFIVVLAFNAAINHLHGEGLNPLRVAQYEYLHPPESSGVERAQLKAALGITCPKAVGNRWNIIAVSYADLNSNTATFYSAQMTFRVDWRCRYGDLGFAPTDLRAALDKIAAVAPPFIVTKDPARQPEPDFVNRLSRPVAEWLAQNPSYVRELAQDNGIIVYRATTP